MFSSSVKLACNMLIELNLLGLNLISLLEFLENLPEPFKAQEHLKKFMMLCKEKSFSNLLRIAIDNNQECPKIIKAVTDVMKRIPQKNPVNDTVKALLDRACPMLIDKPSFIALLKFLKQLIDGISVTDEHEDCSEEELLQKAKTTLKLVKVRTIFEMKTNMI